MRENAHGEGSEDDQAASGSSLEISKAKLCVLKKRLKDQEIATVELARNLLEAGEALE